MADAPLNPPAETFQKPQVAPVASGPLLFTMPPEYRHGGSGKTIHVPSAPAPVASPAPVLAVPLRTSPVAETLKKPRVVSRPLLIGGIVFMVLLLGGVLGFVFWPKAPAPVVATPRPAAPVPRPVTETPAPVPEPVPEPVKEPTTPFPTATIPGTDTDSDGLTDLEERTIYGTDPRLPDSDADGFLDGNEVFHRYNPNGTAPGTLLESGLVRAFSQAAVPALDLPATRLVYPAGWGTSGTYPEAQFKAVTGETVTYVLVKKDAPDQTLLSWKEAHGSKDAAVPSVTKNGYPTLITENQLSAYVDLGSSIGVLTYSTGIKGTVDYLQSFQMMTNSLEKTP